MPTSTISLPNGINKSLSIENLLKVEDYMIKMKKGTANIQEINAFVNSLN